MRIRADLTWSIFRLRPVTAGVTAVVQQLQCRGDFAVQHGLTQRRTKLLLVVVLVIMAMFAVADYFSASARYRRRQDVVTLRYLLSTKIRPNETLQQVTSLLGPGKPAKGDYLSRVLKWQARPDFHPELYPEGIETRDQFVFFTANPKGVYVLQFRDDRLVNFDPTDYVGRDDLLSSLRGN